MRGGAIDPNSPRRGIASVVGAGGEVPPTFRILTESRMFTDVTPRTGIKPTVLIVTFVATDGTCKNRANSQSRSLLPARWQRETGVLPKCS
eukprot:7310163-Prymnesium_polylepis.2